MWWRNKKTISATNSWLNSKTQRKTKIYILAPIIREKKGQHKNVLSEISKKGFIRTRINGEIYKTDGAVSLERNKKHTIEILVDRLIIEKGVSERITESVELALKLGKGLITIYDLNGDEYIYSENFACAKCDISFAEISPRMFSFNSPFGACKKCEGIGSTWKLIQNWLYQIKISPLFKEQ